MISYRRRWTSLLVVGVVVSLIWLSFLESPQRLSSQPANGGITIVVT